MEDGRQAYAAKNYVEAVRLFKKAHRQGHKYAAVWVAEMYREGNGVPKDYAKAVSWYVKAVERGNGTAAYDLGVMYAKGNGVEQSVAKAVSWNVKAVERGNGTAAYDLGVMYAKGNGVEQSDAKAYAWWSVGVHLENLNSRRAMDTLASYMPERDLLKAKKLAKEYWVKHILK